MYGTGFLPTDEAQLYVTREDELYLVGTSEVPLAALHQDEILGPSSLPLRYCGYSTCFRREAGTYGKDTRGMFRVHQFDKVEMFSFVDPSASWEEFDLLVSLQEEIVSSLGIPYRVGPELDEQQEPISVLAKERHPLVGRTMRSPGRSVRFVDDLPHSCDPLGDVLIE